jgi:hypothetical protein
MKSKHLALVIAAILFLIAAFLTLGCAETTLYSPSGQRLARIQADAAKVSYQGNGVRFSADSLNHSSATLAGGRAFAGGVSSVGVAAVGVGTVLLPAGTGIAPLITHTAAIALPATVSASKAK